MNDQTDYVARQVGRLRDQLAAIAAYQPTAQDVADQDTDDKLMAQRIHSARPGVPLHQVYAVLQALRAVQELDRPGCPDPIECGHEAALGQAEESARRALEQRQEMAEERYAWQERGDRAEAVIARVRDALASFDGRGVLAIGATNFDIPTGGEVLDKVRAALAGPGPEETDTTHTEPTCSDRCADVPGIRGLLEHVGIDTSGRDITVAGRVVDSAPPDPWADGGRLAQSGIPTPGCDCGHDGMGISWHGDDCPWRRSAVKDREWLRQQIHAAIESEVYAYRERTMFWEETGGVTQEIARLATRGALEALDQTAPAATRATDAETTTRVFAALHHSAETDVPRVIDLYERWVKAGAPPLGTSMSRWWDARLVELHNAIRPTKEH